MLVFLFVASVTDQRKGRLPLISVAAIDGAAIGGGAELATSCDFRVVGPESSIRFVQVKVRRRARSANGVLAFPPPPFTYRTRACTDAKTCTDAVSKPLM